MGFLKLFDIVPGWVYAALLAAALLTAGVTQTRLSIAKASFATERLEQSKAALKAVDVAQAETLRLQGLKDDALKQAAARAQADAAAARAARAERDGLRDELDAARDLLPSLSHKACLARADSFDTVFRQCTGALEEMARAAAGHANDALTLDQAWPSK